MNRISKIKFLQQGGYRILPAFLKGYTGYEINLIAGFLPSLLHTMI
jgi:hypothetical protein